MKICRRTHGPRFAWFQQDGLELLSLENENVRVVVWPAHGADLIEFRHKATDLDVLWKNPRVWPPRDAGLGQPHGGRAEFYDQFHGGWFVSLPNGFFPGHWPNENGPTIGCHGELQSVAWEVEVTACDAEKVEVLAIGRSVRTPLRLERIWRLRRGSLALEWQETLVNESEMRLPVAWLHHPGFGGPLLQGARLHTSARTLVTPPSQRPELAQLQPDFRGDWPLAPANGAKAWRDCSVVPAAGASEENVIFLTDWPRDDAGRARGWGCLWNEDLRLGFALEWDADLFAYAWSWMAGRSEGYPLWGDCHTATLQPSTSPMRPFDELVERHEVLWLEALGHITTRFSSGFTRELEEIL